MGFQTSASEKDGNKGVLGYDEKKWYIETQIKNEEYKAQKENEALYGSMASGVDANIQAQKDAVQDWADKQTELQQEKTDFAIEKIEQQKDQAKQDYTKEQSGAYVDWQKQSNQYGANAEQMAANGMTNTGYTESSQVSMYNTYQNRITAARESFSRAVLNYDNAIKDAILQNNSILAEIAYEALKSQLELSLQGMQYKNSLLQSMADTKRDISKQYQQKYTDLLGQLNTEAALAEEQRQYDKTYALQQRSVALDEAKFAYQKEQDAKEAVVKKTSGGSSGGGGSSAKSTKSTKSTKTLSNNTTKSKSDIDAYTYLNNLIASGASKDRVANEIAIALRNGQISKGEATILRAKFTPRGVQY